MIKCDFNKVDVRGIEPLILTELTVLMRTVKEQIEERHDKEYADDKIRSCIRKVFATQEELEEDAGQILNESKDSIIKAVISIFEKSHEEE